MNLSTVKNLTIPEGAVRHISINGERVWTRAAKVYGVSWARNTRNTMSRTDLSKSFANPTVGTGTSSGSSAFNNIYPWKDISKVVDGNNTLVKIPKFYFKWTVDSSKVALQISDLPQDGFYVCPLCADRGDGKGERDFAYIGRYRCGKTNYYSKTGLAPQVSMSITTARSKIKSLGTGYYQMDFAAFWTLRMLYLVEFANWDAFSVIPRPTAPSTTNLKSGYTDSMSYHTGTSSNGYSFQYRYVEDPWAGCLEWCDGIYFKNNEVYIINNPNNFNNSSNGTKICTGPQTNMEGYIKNWTVPTAKGCEWALFPSEIISLDDSSTSCVPDAYYQVNGNALYIGGARTIIQRHGPFFIYCDFTDTGTSSVIGTRLMKLP